MLTHFYVLRLSDDIFWRYQVNWQSLRVSLFTQKERKRDAYIFTRIFLHICRQFDKSRYAWVKLQITSYACTLGGTLVLTVSLKYFLHVVFAGKVKNPLVELRIEHVNESMNPPILCLISGL